MIKFLAVLFTLLLAVSIVNAEESSTMELSQDASHACSGGGKHSTAHIFTARDITRISYPNASTALRADELRPQVIVLVKPQRLNREGIYVWRDPEGVWNIRLISKAELDLTGNISTSGNIEAVTESAPGLTIEGAANALIEQRSLPNEDVPPIQFKVNSPDVVFDFLISGKRDPSRIYLGLRGCSPQTIPFRLGNRTKVTPLKNSHKASFSEDEPEKQSIEETINQIPESVDTSVEHESGGSSGGSGHKMQIK